MSGKEKQNTVKFTKVSGEQGRTLGDVAFRPGRMQDATRRLREHTGRGRLAMST